MIFAENKLPHFGGNLTFSCCDGRTNPGSSVFAQKETAHTVQRAAHMKLALAWQKKLPVPFVVALSQNNKST